MSWFSTLGVLSVTVFCHLRNDRLEVLAPLADRKDVACPCVFFDADVSLMT